MTSWLKPKPKPKKKSKYSGKSFMFKPKPQPWELRLKNFKSKLNMAHKKNVLRMFIRKAKQVHFQKKLAMKRGMAKRGLRDLIPNVSSFLGYKR